MKHPFEICLHLAEKASLQNELPVGAVLVRQEKIIARASNETEGRQEFSAHAEMLVLRKASKKLGTKYLVDCELYVSLEPCPMCRAAAQLSRVKAVHWLLDSEKFGASGKALWKTKFEGHSHSPERLAQLKKAKQLLKDFFSSKR